MVRRCRVRMVVGMITTNTISVRLNSAHDEVYSIQHYVIKFVSDLRQVSGTPVSSNNKTDLHDRSEILL